MKLSMSMIYRHLEGRYNLSPDIQFDERTIGGMRLLSDPRLEFSPDYVYVGSMNGFISDPRYTSSIMLASGKSRILCRNCEFEELLNDTLGAFDYYRNWESDLQEASASTSTLQKLLDITASQFDTTLLITDLASQVLAVSRKDGGIQDAPLEQMLREGISSPDVILRRLYTADGKEYLGMSDMPQMFYAAPPATSRFIAAYLYADEEPVAVVFVAQPEPEWVGLYCQLLSIATPFLSRAIEFTAPQARLRSNRSILEDLLEEKPISETVLNKLHQSSNLDAPFSLLVVSHLNRNDRPRITATLRGCNDLHTDSIALEFDSAVLLITHAKDVSTLLGELGATLPLQNFRIGVSLPFEEWTGIAAANRQARFAAASTSSSGICYCKKLAYSYLMKTLREQPMTMELLHPAIEILRLYDEKNGTELLSTLSSYLRNQCSQGKTSRELFIHRNTLTHRLDRILALTDLDLDDNNDREYLSLSLALHTTATRYNQSVSADS